MKRALLISVAWCALATSAWAYILPAGAILRRMVEARDDLHISSFRADGNAALFGPTGASSGVPENSMEASFLMKVPGRCRLELSMPQGRLSAVVSGGRRKSADSGMPPAALVALDETCALLALRSYSEGEGRAQVLKHLHALKVDVSATHFGRTERQKVVYVLGDSAPNRPQLWVTKNGFLPAQIRFASEDGGTWEVRLLDFASPATGEYFPRVVEVRKNGELTFRFSSTKGDARANLSDKLF